MALACSVGLVDHWLDDSPPGVDEPEEEQETGSDVTIQKQSQVKSSWARQAK